ncbi:hypothetical protein E2562_012982 [Oryza meyeriana var. granulata]|uniref:Uncharacterized protein n=1 Tax=Oryza meyeriana var. granulata TaxID=110450 RepID=A0A6G1DK19_9ORYZ|nr:hypothetical protein E2562_012982 [Oryza meyeriana var. granulata]
MGYIAVVRSGSFACFFSSGWFHRLCTLSSCSFTHVERCYSFHTVTLRLPRCRRKSTETNFMESPARPMVR